MTPPDGRQLPSPVTTEQEYLAAIHDLIADIHRTLVPSSDGDGETLLTEPAERPAPVDVDDFHAGGGWYEVGGEKVRGREAAEKLLAG